MPSVEVLVVFESAVMPMLMWMMIPMPITVVIVLSRVEQTFEDEDQVDDEIGFDSIDVDHDDSIGNDADADEDADDGGDDDVSAMNAKR